MEQRSGDDRRSTERALDRIRWRLDALDKWRQDTEDHLVALTARFEAMARADEIAKAVTDRMHKDTSIGFTGLQKLGALAVGLLVAADAIKGLVS